MAIEYSIASGSAVSEDRCTIATGLLPLSQVHEFIHDVEGEHLWAGVNRHGLVHMQIRRMLLVALIAGVSAYTGSISPFPISYQCQSQGPDR